MRELSSATALAWSYTVDGAGWCFYASWPLGYWLNPVANRGLASNLEAAHQPYNWVFIAFDIVSGLLICVVSGLAAAASTGCGIPSCLPTPCLASEYLDYLRR